MTSTFFDQVSKIQAGETVGPIPLSYADFPRSKNWSLTFILFGESGKEIEQSAAAGSDNDSFALTLPAKTTTEPAVTGTDSLRGGRKSFVIEASHSTEGTFVAERGSLTVLFNPRVTTAEMTILAAIRAVKAGLAVDGQRTIALDGIQLTHMTPSQLDSWEAKYVRIVKSQIGQAGGNGGQYAIKIRTPEDHRYAAPWYGPYPPPGGRP